MRASTRSESNKARGDKVPMEKIATAWMPMMKAEPTIADAT